MHGGALQWVAERQCRPTVAERVLAVHKLHPDWPQIKIARHLGLQKNAVCRATKMLGITLPHALPRYIDKLVALHREHPEWDAEQLARALGATRKYVHDASIRLDLTIPKAKGKPGRPRIPIPKWVPIHMHGDYRELALLDGEEAAASWARRAKRESVAS